MTFKSRLQAMLVVVLTSGSMVVAPMAAAQDANVTGQIEWGVWVDADGCQHWWADGGTEGYMVPRRNPKTGKPVCTKPVGCMSASTDTFFATASARLTASGREALEAFFRTSDAYSFSIAGHTDSRGSDSYNQGLSEARVKSVADVARSVGAVIDSETGLAKSSRLPRTAPTQAWPRTAVSKSSARKAEDHDACRISNRAGPRWGDGCAGFGGCGL